MTDEKKEHDENELVLRMHKKHKDICEPFAKRLVDIKHSGDADSLLFLIENLDVLKKLAVELLRSKEVVLRESWESKH